MFCSLRFCCGRKRRCDHFTTQVHDVDSVCLILIYLLTIARSLSRASVEGFLNPGFGQTEMEAPTLKELRKSEKTYAAPTGLSQFGRLQTQGSSNPGL